MKSSRKPERNKLRPLDLWIEEDEIDFSGKELSNQDIISLARTLKWGGNKITSLNLADCQVTDNSLQILLKEITQHPNLLRLNLEHNCITTVGARALAKMLEVNCHLKELHLTGNPLSKEDILIIGNGLHKNTSLQILDFLIGTRETSISVYPPTPDLPICCGFVITDSLYFSIRHSSGSGYTSDLKEFFIKSTLMIDAEISHERDRLQFYAPDGKMCTLILGSVESTADQLSRMDGCRSSSSFNYIFERISCRQAKILVFCFSVEDSYREVEDQLFELYRESVIYDTPPPLIVVATQCHLRSEKTLSYGQGKELSAKYGAITYIERGSAAVQEDLLLRILSITGDAKKTADEISYLDVLNKRTNQMFLEVCTAHVLKNYRDYSLFLVKVLSNPQNEVSSIYGYTPLHIAAYVGNDDLIEPLLEEGCSMLALDKKKRTALQLAELLGHDAFIKRWRLIERENREKHHLEKLIQDATQTRREIQNFATRQQELKKDIQALLKIDGQEEAGWVQQIWTTLFELRQFRAELQPFFNPWDLKFPGILIRQEIFGKGERLKMSFKKDITKTHPMFKILIKQKKHLQQVHKKLLLINLTSPGILNSLERFIIFHEEYIDKVCNAATETARQRLYHWPVLMCGVSLSPCFLSETAGKALTPMIGEARQNEHGTASVYQVGNIHFKYNPHAPGVEFMVSSLGDLLAGQGATPTELLKVIGEDGYPRIYQASKTVQGKELDYVLEKHPEYLEKLNAKNFSAMVVLGLLTDPQDGKPDNYMVEFSVNENGQIESLEIVGIDNDIAFADPMVLSHTSKQDEENKYSRAQHFVNIKNALYFFPQMRESINLEYRELFLQRVPELLLLNWLQGLYKKNKEYQALLDQGVFTQEEFFGDGKVNKRGLQLPIKLVSGTVKKLYRKLIKLSELLDQPTVTHEQLFQNLCPEIARHYAAVQERCGDDIKACSKALYEESIENFEELEIFRREVAAGNTSYMTATVLKTAQQFGFEDHRTQAITGSMIELLATIDYSRFSGRSAAMLYQAIAQALGLLFPKKQPLHFAVEQQQLPLVNWLLQEELVSVNQTNEAHYTALHIAASLGNKSIVISLLEHGASPVAQDKLGKTPLDKALTQSIRQGDEGESKTQQAMRQARQQSCAEVAQYITAYQCKEITQEPTFFANASVLQQSKQSGSCVATFSGSVPQPVLHMQQQRPSHQLRGRGRGRGSRISSSSDPHQPSPVVLSESKLMQSHQSAIVFFNMSSREKQQLPTGEKHDLALRGRGHGRGSS